MEVNTSKCNGKKEKICGIYKITNKVNGKVYIGQSVDIYKRWSSHIRNSKNENCKDYNYPFYRALRKYGVENFDFEILEVCDDVNLLDDKEIAYIKQYNSFIHSENSNGYNNTLGGNQGSRGRIKSEEEKRKIAENRVYTYGSENPNSKPVIFDGIEYGCAKDICDKFGFNLKRIRTYLNHNNQMPVEFYVLGLRYKSENMNTYKICTDKDDCNKETYLDGILFKTASECSKYCGVPPKTLRSWLSGARRMPKEYYDRGLRYSYKEMKDYHHQEELIVKDKIKNKPKKYIEMNIQLYCDNMLFYSKQHFSEYYGLRYSTVAGWFGKSKINEKFKELGLKEITKEEAKCLIEKYNIKYAEL